jgi:hypothetical protein
LWNESFFSAPPLKRDPVARTERSHVPSRRMMIPILFFPFFFEIPAIGFAFFWMLTQIIPGIATLMIMPLVRRPARSYRRYYADEGHYGFLPNGRRLGGEQRWV